MEFTSTNCCRIVANDGPPERDARVRTSRGSEKLLRRGGQARHVEVAGEPARERAGKLVVGETAEPFNAQAQLDRSRRGLLRTLRENRARGAAGRRTLDPNSIGTRWSGESDGSAGVCDTARVARASRVLREVPQDPHQALLQQSCARPG